MGPQKKGEKVPHHQSNSANWSSKRLADCQAI
jgi:hypothetical protein